MLGQQVATAVDAAQTRDTTACAWACPLPDGRIFVDAYVWAAHRRVAAHEYHGVERGKIRLAAVEQFIAGHHLEGVEEPAGGSLATRYTVYPFVYDPRYFTRSAELLEEAGFTCAPMWQNQPVQLEAVQRFYDLVHEGRLVHNGNKVLEAHVQATAAEKLERGWRLSKLRSGRAIDACVAAIMAVFFADQGGGEPGVFAVGEDGEPVEATDELLEAMFGPAAGYAWLDDVFASPTVGDA